MIDKICENYPLKLGRLCVLTVEEEQLIAKTLGAVSNWGFPLTHQDIRLVVAKFVMKQCRNIPGWKNNEPGLDFIYKFTERDNLTTRLALNINRQRANVSHSSNVGL